MRNFTRHQVTPTSPLSNEELLVKVPSVFAETPHASRSKRYTHIPTVHVLDALRSNGFVPMWAHQSKVRSDDTRNDFTKHMIRLRWQGDIGTPTLGEIFPEVVLINSHDGSSSYKLMAGLFRLVCGEGYEGSSGDVAEGGAGAGVAHAMQRERRVG